MPNSIREQILQAITVILAPIATAQSATLLRSPPTGIPREQSPALLVFPESDTIHEYPNDRVERLLIVRIVALARESGGETPELIADRILVDTHAALFAHANLNGLALGIKELDCNWDIEDADAGVCAIPSRYQITYRTLASDLTQKG